jgi:MoaA/NifB/PqqE/SkfB family radical SAM enzyme
MFNFKELKSIHLELSTRCQASCPMCARNNHGGLPNPNLKIADMSLATFKKIVTAEVLETVNHMCFCGNFGDPIMNNDLIDICRYLKETSDNVNVHIHTNGGARSTEWWEELKEALPEKHCVFFAIDGLEDTHHIYRIGTTYENVTKNAKTFIDAGGRAEWVFIKFKHNEHQAKEAERRSKELGFSTFTMKNTNRFIGENRFSVVDKDGAHQYYLEPPTDNKVAEITKADIDHFMKNYQSCNIECYAKKHKEVYIDVHGRISPCCFIAHAPYNYPDNRTIVKDVKTQIVNQYYNLTDDLGGVERLDLKQHSIKDVFDSEPWHTVWDKYWGTDKSIMCAKTCGDFKNSKPKEQIIETVNLDDLEDL